MRAFSIAALLSLSVGLMYAQAPPTHDAELRLLQSHVQQQALARGLAERERKTLCSLPDGSNHPLGTSMSYQGQTYRCVEALRSDGATLTTYAAAWVKVPLN
jgi:hypothetical protein